LLMALPLDKLDGLSVQQDLEQIAKQ